MPLTTHERAARALTARGYAPNLLRSCDAAELTALAALCGEDGTLADDLPAKLRAWLEAYYAARKAVVED